MARFESEGTWFSKEAEAKRSEERWRKQTGWHRFTRAVFYGAGGGGGLAPGATCGPATVSFPHGDSTPSAPKPGEVVGHFYNHATGEIDTLREIDPLRELAEAAARASAFERLKVLHDRMDRRGVGVVGARKETAMGALCEYQHAVGALLRATGRL